jgi:putative Ca2+/H+ antiporter (TMEM165/GDT1 family)
MNDVFFAFFERAYENLLTVIESSHLHDLSTPALTSFLLIVAAEMGDKSQLVCMTLAARHRPVPVALGAVLAFAVLNTLAVVFGFQIANWLPPYLISSVVALLFFGFGIHSLRVNDEDEDETPAIKSSHNIFLTTFLLIVVAEFGDKTQLAVVALSSTLSPIAVWLGSTVALACTSILGCLAGRAILQKISLNWLHRISGAFFLLLAAFAAYQAFSSLYSTI